MYRNQLLLTFAFCCAVGLAHAQTNAKSVTAPLPPVVAAPADTSACIAPTTIYTATTLDATARTLAGFPVTGTDAVANLANGPGGKAHAAAMNVQWNKLDAKQLDKVKAFAKLNVTDMAGTAPLYYPFSGPDLLYAEAFFPNASGYLLTGLEPVGQVPAIASFSPAELAASFADLRKSLHSILSFSFFRTIDMKVDFKKNRLQGVVPVLLSFAVKSGFSVQGASFFVLNPDGSKCITDANRLAKVKAPQIPGVALSLQRAGEKLPRSLIYLSADIGDSGIVKTPQYDKLVQGYGHRATFLKSASFLMHKDYFSKVRSLILATSTFVLQDDSGIPYRKFEPAMWQPTFFGSYVKPIPLFANYDQKDMHAAFKTMGSKVLEFGIGYRYSKKDSSLLLFTKKK
jgi:hypothetical protein